MDPVALASVISSGVVAVAGLFVTYRGRRDQRKQEIRLEEVRLRKEFLIEGYRHCLTAYSPVLRTLGTVSDLDLRGDRQANDVVAPDRLQRAADELHDQLYGEAGLLMTMESRNWIHVARQEAMSYQRSQRTADDRDKLGDAFFYARRAIRRDLDLKDDQEPTTVESLTARLSDRTDRRP
jgi:hypothetical protein